MPSYPHSWLMLADPLGTPQELINGARLARNLLAANLCGNGMFDNVLTNLGCDGYTWQPTAPTALNDAVLWLDAADGSPTREIAPNRGTGGPLLNGTLGATTASSTDQPLWLGGTEKYLYTPAIAGNNATVPNSAPLQITGDIEIVARIAADDWTPSATQSVISKYAAAAAGYEFNVNTDGTLRFVARLAASDITVNSTAALPAVNGQDYWIKVTRASASGTVTFWYAIGGSNVEPATYAQLGTAVVSTTGNITSGSQIVYIGERAAAQPLGGKFFRAIVRNAIGASTPTNVLDINFTTNTSQTSFTAAAGGVVTINRTSTGRKSVAYQGRPLWLFGTDDFINIPDNNLIDFAGNESLTLLAVQRVHNVAVGSVQAILADQTGTTAQGISLTNGTAAASGFTVHDGSVGTTVNIGTKTASTLHVIGGVRDVVTDALQTYLDGVAAGFSTDPTTGTLNNAQPLRVGGFSAGASPLDAEILAVLIWRRALSATEMAAVSSYFKGVPQQNGLCWTQASFGAGTDPWYDYRLPESLEAYGFLIEEWTGLDGAHHVRSSGPTGQNRGGSYFGPQSHNMRTMKLNVLLHGSTERGLNYLFNWLESKLLHCCGAVCDTQFAWLRQVCPNDPVAHPEEGVLRAERVALLDGPTWEAAPMQDAGCFLRRVSFTLGVGDPCLYREATPLAFAEVTTTGTGTGNVQSNCATFAGNQRQVRANMAGPPGFGQTAPIVTIYSPPETILGTRAGLPVLRIAGYVDPYGTGNACSANQVGELILEGHESSGYEIVVDMAKRKIRMRAAGSSSWLDGSRLIGRTLRSGLPRWWSFGSCDSGFVVVEPAFTNLETASLNPTATQVSKWTVRIEAATRQSCC